VAETIGQFTSSDLFEAMAAVPTRRAPNFAGADSICRRISAADMLGVRPGCRAVNSPGRCCRGSRLPTLGT
jgi:hypothetical protein